MHQSYRSTGWGSYSDSDMSDADFKKRYDEKFKSSVGKSARQIEDEKNTIEIHEAFLELSECEDWLKTFRKQLDNLNREIFVIPYPCRNVTTLGIVETDLKLLPPEGYKFSIGGSYINEEDLGSYLLKAKEFRTQAGKRKPGDIALAGKAIERKVLKPGIGIVTSVTSLPMVLNLEKTNN